MTNPNLTQLLVILDRSGSMTACRSDMELGLNEFFKNQAKEDGTCVVDFVQFDDRYNVVYTDRDVNEAKAVLEPRGMTALLDAIGRGVTDLGAKLRNLDESDRPGTVIVIVVTDGMENASREWSASKVRELIKRQEDEWDWNFTFLGANMDAVEVGNSFGFNRDHSLTYDTNNIGAMTASLNTYTTNTRSHLLNAYSDDDRMANSKA